MVVLVLMVMVMVMVVVVVVVVVLVTIQVGSPVVERCTVRMRVTMSAGHGHQPRTAT